MARLLQGSLDDDASYCNTPAIPHHRIVEALVENPSLRQIGVIQEEYAVFKDDSPSGSETLTTRV